MLIVKGPVAFAFSVAKIVVLDVNDGELVLKIPPALKFPLFSLGGVLSLLAIRSIASAIAGFASMIANIGASTFGLGVLPALAVVGSGVVAGGCRYW